MAVDGIANNFHGVEKPKDYFKQIDDRKKVRAEKVETDFSKMLKTETTNGVEKSSLRGAQATKQSQEKRGVNSEVAAKASTARNDSLGLKPAVNDNDKNGTDLALKKVAEDFEKQILGIMWNLAFSTVDREFQGGLGEEIFHKELVNEMVKLSNTGEMGEIAQSIYNDLKAKEALNRTQR